MAVTKIICNEWVLNDEGKLIPLIHFDPVTVNGKVFGQCTGYSFWWLFERGLGVGATIFIDTRAPGRTGYVSYVNDPRVPNAPVFCECGKLLKAVGRHLQCLQPEKKCLRRGIHAWLLEEPLNWIQASLKYEDSTWTYFRDVPNYFEPRST